MRNSYSIRWLWVPYLYTVHTRAPTLRDNLANISTAWVPGILLLLLLGEGGFAVSSINFLIGYLAFICLYEVSYLANDTLGLRTDEAPNDRLGFRMDRGFVTTFVLVRLLIFIFSTIWLNVLVSTIYLVSVAVLITVSILHNTPRSAGYKFFSFFQMSALRFFLPIYPGLRLVGAEDSALLVLIIGVFCFSFPRLLTYQESKHRLDIPERRDSRFHLHSMLMTSPIMVGLSVLTHEVASMVVWAWLCFVGLVHSLHSFSKQR